MSRHFILAVGLLAGTIIGAGIFSLPYLFRLLGYLPGLIYLGGFALIYHIIHLMYGKILLANNEKEHQFFFLANKYLSPFWARVASGAILGELLLALTVYLILAPVFGALVGGWGEPVWFFGFWILGSFFIFAKVDWMSLAEILGLLGILAIVAVVFSVGAGLPSQMSWGEELNLGVIFLPFGPLLFSFAGRPALHEVIKEYRAAERKARPFSLSRAVGWGTAIPAFIYLIFVWAILKLNPQITPEALNGLDFLSPRLLALLGVMGLITLWTSYFVLGANVKEILKIDLRWSRFLAGLTVLLLPPLFYLAGLRGFLTAIGLTGGLFLALEGIFVVRMWQKAFPDSPWRRASHALYLIFAAAILYQANFLF